MDPDSKRRGYINYPEPIKGPDVPYFNGRKSNPALRGPILVVCAYIMEWLGFVRHFVWLNAGFGSLRKIFVDIQDYEPFYEPTIVPLPDPDAPEWTKESRLDLTLPASLPVPAADKYPSTRYYTAEDYHNLYLSGKLTPTDVARSLLPLIRKKGSSAGEEPGPHQVAFFQSREELVLKAAEASTLRYRKKKSLGPLDGVPTAVKNEYDMDGYKSCLGSVNDYTSDQFEDGSIDCWSVRKLKEAGCVIIGSLHMVEFGLDTPGNNTNYGTPPNPYNPKYYTGGSSSGCGYAVASGLIPFALGSDGGGSVRIPASFCSVYGLKPTHGRLSFKPGQNHCMTCACLGPLAGDLRTLATVYSVLGQPHPTSIFPPVPPPSVLLDRAQPSYPSSLSVTHSSATSQRTLGIPRAWFERADSVVRELCLSYIDRLVREHGYETVDIEIPYLVEGQTAHALTVLTDAAGLLPEYGNLTMANRILLALGRTTPSTDHLLAQKLRRLLANHLSHLWHKYPGMVIMTPTTSCAGWPVRNPNESHWGISDGDTTIRTMEYVWLANFCGLPSISFPAGYAVPEGQPNAGTIAGPDVVGKVPVGIMATSEWATETDLLRLGLDAEVISAERNVRAPNWVDVIGTAQKTKPEASE
ncbi:Amidase family protein [Sporothrix schenckii 1099-18]|uniref:Amidase family protein n=1 Tax=Sporothrix schenckii 1099-18 TaxID=1397361 RepID=A0A0F2LY88_SPOSC|nr:Amidase family protein [Sporothrix schenckii 1099-18]KJR82428.1 Amidase family protein [Sporothrix schenckii 1099-18]